MEVLAVIRQSGDSSKSIRQRRREKREQQARSRGYLDEWPPRRPQIESPADFEHVLARVEAGERRAGFIYGLATHCLDFVDELRPEHFARFCRQLVVTVEDAHTAPRTQLRAIQAVAKVLRDGVGLLRRLQVQPASELPRIAHAYCCLASFWQTMGAKQLRRMTDLLLKVAETAESPRTAIRAAETSARLMTDLAETLVDLQELRPRDGEGER